MERIVEETKDIIAGIGQMFWAGKEMLIAFLIAVAVLYLLGIPATDSAPAHAVKIVMP